MTLLGWRTDLPMPGEPVYEVESEARARAVIMVGFFFLIILFRKYKIQLTFHSFELNVR